MNFDELNKLIPYARYGKEKVLKMEPYPGIVLLLPGRHAEDTTPKGGDFCVCVNDSAFKSKQHQFTHTDLFVDMERRVANGIAEQTCANYLKIITGGDPDNISPAVPTTETIVGAHCWQYAVQCLAVAEHRRYAQYENKFGGRFLPFRFAAGIAQGLWTATDAAEKQRRGRPGVEWLEKDHGVPILTKELFDART